MRLIKSEKIPEEGRTAKSCCLCFAAVFNTFSPVSDLPSKLTVTCLTGITSSSAILVQGAFGTQPSTW
jgi:hypothetical protein